MPSFWQSKVFFYIYAPKADHVLRRSWRDDWDNDTRAELQMLAKAYHDKGLKFGLGLSLFGAGNLPLEELMDDLAKKISAIDLIGADILSIQFDDMKGDLPGLADAQVNIAHFIAQKSKATQIILCPTYYSNSPTLDRIFGKRPETYLRDLGELLDPAIGIFWTGEEVCSVSYPRVHLEEVSAILKRKPFLWDNYPVNDGKRKSNYLYLLPPDRPRSLLSSISGLACNPMNQPFLSHIPIRALAGSLGLRESAVASVAEFESACRALTGEELSHELIRDAALFQNSGLANMTAEEKHACELVYSRYPDSPYAREVVAWLRGAYVFDENYLLD